MTEQFFSLLICKMARSDEAQAFFHAVYSAAQQIPYGKVTTYAHLAYLVGTRMFHSIVFNSSTLNDVSMRVMGF